MRPVKTLIVSRKPAARAWMRMALGPHFTITEAADGIEALKLSRSDLFDVVIADELTEPFGAFGLARELKMSDEPPMVVILLDRAQDTWLAKWSGADRWLVQPVDPFELAATAAALGGSDRIETDEGGNEQPPRAHAVAGTPYSEANAPADAD
jgi:DNA-binding response OmpR family regulator